MKKILFNIWTELFVFLLSVFMISCSAFIDSDTPSISVTLPDVSVRGAAPESLSYYKVGVVTNAAAEKIAAETSDSDEIVADMSSADTDEDIYSAAFVDEIFKNYAVQYKLNVTPGSTIEFSDVEEGTYVVYVLAFDAGSEMIASGTSRVTVENGKTADANVVLQVFKTVASPVFSVGSGEISSGTTVEITCATEGAEILYTTNGLSPMVDGILYTAPVIITESCTLKAIAIKDDWKNSPVVSAGYTIKTVVTSWNDLGVAIAANGAVEKTVYIGADLTAGSCLSPLGKTTIISEGTYTITRDSTFTGSFFEVADGATLELKASGETCSLTLDGNSDGSVEAPLITSSGTLNIYSNVVLENNNNASTSGGGIQVKAGITTLAGGAVRGCHASGYGCNAGGIDVASGAEFDMTSGDISSNTADGTDGGAGGGINSAGTIKLTGGTISGNYGASWGGGINVGGKSEATVENVTITAGNHSNNGGGIANWGKLTLKNTVITGNTAEENPDRGGVCNCGELTIDSADISGNTDADLYNSDSETYTIYLKGYTFSTEETYTIYTVNYVTQYGTAPATTSAVSGQCYVDNNLPVLEAVDVHTFGGWYSDSGYENAVTTKTEVKGNINLYAKWN